MIDDTITSSPHSHAFPRCHVCGDQNFEVFDEYSRFHRVTSDCKPMPCGGTLGLCHSCGCVQKLINTTWQADTDAIYDAYSIYYQSAGTEQVVFDQKSGTPTSRSLQILNCVSQVMQLPETGKHLDIGCGNGALLHQFHEKFPEWTLFGIELNEKYKDMVEAIPRVEKMYVSSQPDIIHDIFNSITMVHVLEHILHPREYLEKIHALLTYEGFLIIEVPFFVKNPYDLLT
jgi:SAM-dependent methyltransferase